MAPDVMAQGTLYALRQKIAQIEGQLPEKLEPDSESGRTVLRRNGRPCLAINTGAEALDVALGDQQPTLVDISGRQSRDSGAVSGFALALAARACRKALRDPRWVLWVGLDEVFFETGLPYALGLEHFFAQPAEQLLLAHAPKLEDALWIAEEALKAGTFSAIFLELRGNPGRLDLTATRRLRHRAEQAFMPLFLIRHSGSSEGSGQPSAALVRLCISPAPSRFRHIAGEALPRSIGPPAFCVELRKSRSGRTGTHWLEWNADDFTFQERTAPGQGNRNTAKTSHTGSVLSAPFHGPHSAPQIRSPLADERRSG